jgi:hypothetical protein
MERTVPEQIFEQDAKPSLNITPPLVKLHTLSTVDRNKAIWVLAQRFAIAWSKALDAYQRAHGALPQESNLQVLDSIKFVVNLHPTAVEIDNSNDDIYFDIEYTNSDGTTKAIVVYYRNTKLGSIPVRSSNGDKPCA